MVNHRLGDGRRVARAVNVALGRPQLERTTRIERLHIRHRTVLGFLVLGALLLASCGEGGSSSSTPRSTAWQDIALTDVDGAAFSIRELEGTPVFVENFATWCSNCRKQLGDTQAAATVAGDGAVFVALSVETDIDADTVKDYAASHGFTDIRFAVMTPEMLAAMDDAFGKSALNPPSTPKIVVDSAGRAGNLTTGFESPEAIASALASTR